MKSEERLLTSRDVTVLFFALAVPGGAGLRPAGWGLACVATFVTSAVGEFSAKRAFEPGASDAVTFNALVCCFSFPGEAIVGVTMLVFGAKKLDIARMPAASPESRLGGVMVTSSCVGPIRVRTPRARLRVRVGPSETKLISKHSCVLNADSDSAARV